MTNTRSPMPLYRNTVSTEFSLNNKKIVLLTVLLYCYSSTGPGYAPAHTTHSQGRESRSQLLQRKSPERSTLSLSRVRHDTTRIRRRLVPVLLPRPIRRRRHILPRESQRPHKNQWINPRFLHYNSMRRSQRWRGRIRRPIWSRAARSVTTNNVGRHGLSARTYHYHVRQHFSYRNCYRQHQTKAQQSSRHALSLDQRSRATKSIHHRLYPHAAKPGGLLH